METPPKPASDVAKPLSSGTRVTITIGAICAAAGMLWAAGGAHQSIVSELRHLGEGMTSLNSKIDVIDSIDRRLTTVEARLETLLRRDQP